MWKPRNIPGVVKSEDPWVLHVLSGQLELGFASEADVKRQTTSLQSFRPDYHPKDLDSFEYTALALRRWKEARAKHRAVTHFSDIGEFVRDNPNAEVSALILATAPGLTTGSTVGLAYIRRTWCNNVCIEFLTRHPKYARACPVKGVGTSLMHYICKIAEKLGASEIWAESTQSSVEFYRKAFERPELTDLMRIGREEYCKFIVRTATLAQVASSPTA
jgi:N-acetylglutamate synthase-like GNAT family acetyltransferase